MKAYKNEKKNLFNIRFVRQNLHRIFYKAMQYYLEGDQVCYDAMYFELEMKIFFSLKRILCVDVVNFLHC